jgi:hypothetical protein
MSLTLRRFPSPCGGGAGIVGALRLELVLPALEEEAALMVLLLLLFDVGRMCDKEMVRSMRENHSRVADGGRRFVWGVDSSGGMGFCGGIDCCGGGCTFFLVVSFSLSSSSSITSGVAPYYLIINDTPVSISVSK